MCKKKSKKNLALGPFSVQNSSKSTSKQIYDDYIEYGSAYLSDKSQKHRELYRNLVSPDNYEKAKLSIAGHDIQDEAKKKIRTCQIEKPITQIIVDIAMMLLCIAILVIQYKLYFNFDIGKKKKLYNFVVKKFGCIPDSEGKK